MIKLSNGNRVIRRFLCWPRKLVHWDHSYGTVWRWFGFAHVEQMLDLSSGSWIDVAWAKKPVVVNPILDKLGLVAVKELYKLIKGWATAKIHTYEFPRPAITADFIVICETLDGDEIALVERANEPYKGSLALPGGFMNINETSEEAAFRELKEETGIDKEDFKFYWPSPLLADGVSRDPRDRVVTVARFGIVSEEVKDKAKAGDDAANLKWVSVNQLDTYKLAFDHKEIIDRARREFVW